MNLPTSKYQRLSITLLVLILAIMTTLFAGNTKSINQYNWLDILGEGSIVIAIIAWILFSVISRPSGTVTNKLFIGLNLLLLTALLDFLDEFIQYPSSNAWLTTIESLPALFGMLVMTWALKSLHHEQQSINRQLFKQERFYREHQQVDYITGLHSAQYIRQQIGREIDCSPEQFSLLMIDIRQFDHFNRQYGETLGNSLLADVAKLLMMNVRSTDLVCRYASDCFIILLPHTKITAASEIANQIELSLAHLAFKPTQQPSAVYPLILWSALSHQHEKNAQQIIVGLADALLAQKADQRVA